MTKQVENRVRWPDLEQRTGEWGGVRAVIMRLWIKRAGDSSESLAVVGVNFSGLICIGDKISRSCVSNLKSNSVVFKIHHHFFVSNDCLHNRIEQFRFIEVPFMTVDSCKSSYDRVSLSKLAATLRALKQSEASNSRVKKEIALRGLEPGSVSLAPQTASLRQQIFSVQPKLPATKMTEISLSTKIEDIKFRIDLLKNERDRLRNALALKKELREQSVTDGDECNSRLMENYHTLSKDREKLETWLQTFQETRDFNRKTSESLRLRRNQLISQLSEIFPIFDTNSHLPTICHVALPGSEIMRERDDTDLAVGLGWATHLTVMVSCLLGVPLRYPTTSAGSRSSIEDQVLDKIPDKEREFPLYAKGVERVRFEYGVYLLNKNIAQLRWYCGIHTSDLRPTLSNLHELLGSCKNTVIGESHHSNSSSSSPARFQLPVAPPVLAGVAKPGIPLLTVNSPVRRISSTEKEEISSESDEAICVKESSKTEVDNNPDTLHGLGKKAETFCDKDHIDKAPVVGVPDHDENNRPVIPNPTNSVSEISIGTANGVSEEEFPIEGSSEAVEEAEAADIFWDSLSGRTQALAAPNSFKTHLGRSYK